LELGGGKVRVLALDFLEAGNIRLALFEPFEQPRPAGANPVDIEAGDEHSGPLVCEFDYGAIAQPTTDGPGGQTTSARRRYQMPKLVPQPHPAAACGFSTRKAVPPRDSTKSTVLPATSSRLTGSTTSFTSPVSLTWSSSSGAAAKPNLYWNPEHPPPSTDRRRIGGPRCRGS